MPSPSNLVLIGMPGAGKSTVGVLLAKALALGFVDTDVIIQQRERRRLHAIIAASGLAAFREIEERAVLAMNVRRHVIATGGSVVYSDAAMAHLRRDGQIVWLDVPIAELERRLGNLVSRGVVIRPGQSLAELAAERQPLYERHADHRLDCAGLTHEAVLAKLLALLPAS